MASDLERLLEGYKPTGDFRPYCYASKHADSVTIYLRPDADYSKRLTEHVTLLLSIETNQIIGCRIKGFSGIVESLPNYVDVKHEGHRLSIIILPFLGEAKDREAREQLNELARAASEVPFDLQECSAG